MSIHDSLFRKPNWATIPKDRSTFPPLTDEERAAILATREPTRCPTVRIVSTFRQQLSETA